MGLLDIFCNKKSIVEEANEKINMVDESFIESAEKTANIISQTIKDGKFEIITKQLEKYSLVSQDKENFVFGRPALTRWVIAFLIGVFFLIGFLYFFVIATGTFLYSETHRMYGGYGMLITVAFTIFNIFMVQRAVKEIQFSRRYDHYQNILQYRNSENVNDLAYLIGVDRSVVEKDLIKAVKDKLIPQGHFGCENIIFMASDVAFSEYSKRQAIYDEYFKKSIEQRSRLKEWSKETEELLEQGREYIERIRCRGDFIKNKKISKELDRMERVVSVIFHEFDINPVQAKKLGVFMKYYLSTIEKLLGAYIELDEKQFKGKGTEMIQKDVSCALDSINNAFEGLLERFYQEQEHGVTSEIYEIEAIMKHEGLWINKKEN